MYFLFDIGGTNMRGAISDGTSIVRKKIIPTPDTYNIGIEELSTIALELSEGATYKNAIGGIAGMLDREKEKLLLSPNLKDWVGRPFKKDISDRLRIPVTIENDAALAGLGEAIHGSGRGYRIVMYFGIGTGVGGVRIVDSRIDQYTFGFEPGHQIINASLHDNLKTLEEIVSGSGIMRTTGKMPSDIDDQSFWDGANKSLSIGINNSILHWSPDIVVLGGGLIEQNIFNIEEIERNLASFLFYLPEVPKIVKSKLLDESAFYGAMSIPSNL